MVPKSLLLFCVDCMDTVHKDGWSVNLDGKKVGLCGECCRRYRQEGSGPVAIKAVLPAVLDAIGQHHQGVIAAVEGFYDGTTPRRTGKSRRSRRKGTVAGRCRTGHSKLPLLRSNAPGGALPGTADAGLTTKKAGNN